MGFWQKQKESNNQEVRESNMEELLYEYIDSLQKLRYESQSNPQAKFDTYHALVRMGASKEPENGEAKRQSDFLRELSKKGEYEYILGRNSHGRATFCQVVTDGYKLDDEKQKVQKLYINCDRDKITDIVQSILSSCNKQKVDISLKFVCEDGQSNNYLRNDKIVIYCEDDDKKTKITTMIDEIAAKQPKLFNANKEIPFMPKSSQSKFVSTPGITQHGRYIVYNSSGGNLNRAIVNTYNNILAEALQESFVISTSLASDKCYSERDEKTGTLLATSERVKEGLDVFYNLDEESRKEIVGTMKTILPDICKANNIMINPKLVDKEHKMYMPLNDPETTDDFYNTSVDKKSISKPSHGLE